MKIKCKHFRNMVIDCILCENNMNCVNGMVTTTVFRVLKMWLQMGQKEVSNWKNCNTVECEFCLCIIISPHRFFEHWC